MRNKIVDLNAQKEEARKLNGLLTNEQNDRESLHARLEAEVESLRHELEGKDKNLSQYQQLEKTRKALNEMLVKPISTVIITGLVFKEEPSPKEEKVEGSITHEMEVGKSNINKEKEFGG